MVRGISVLGYLIVPAWIGALLLGPVAAIAEPLPGSDAPVLISGDAQESGESLAASIESVVEDPDAAASETGEKTLAGLVGKTDIAVLGSVDWRLIKSLDEDPAADDLSASQVAKLNLPESVSAGRSFSRDSLAALSRTEQAEARSGQALGLLLPVLSLRASSGSETSKPSVELDDEGNRIAKDTHNRKDMTLFVRQPLFDLPSFFEWRRRKTLEQSSQETYRVNDGDAYLSSVNAYVALVATRLQAELTRDFEKQLAELLVYVEKRARGGAASNADLERVRARSQETLSLRLEQEAAHEAAGIEFVRLTNLVPQTVRIPGFGDVGAAALPATFEAAVPAAMNVNPEIAGLTAEVKAANLDRSAAQGEFLPRLEAEYSDTFSLHAGGDKDPDGQRDRRAMLVLSWTPLNGGRDYYAYRERTARREELRYRLDGERRRIVQALSANYALLETTRARIDTGYQEMRSISLAVAAMSKRMLSGNQSLLDLLDVYDRHYRVRSRLVDLHALELRTAAQLVRLTHGAPWLDVSGVPAASAEVPSSH